MILPDVNLLLYAYNTDAREYRVSKAWLKSTIEGDYKLCLSWHTIMGFLRISTSFRIFPKPYTTEDALKIVSDLIDAPNTIVLRPETLHFRIFEKLVKESRISGANLMDAHIAALAIEHGATVATTNRDFHRFDGLKIINPL